MKILAVDDEKIILNSFVEEVKKVFPNGDIHSFSDGKEALDYLKEIIDAGEKLSYAFLDIKLRGMTGIELAKDIKKLCPDTHIIFCTGYSEYAFQAYDVFAKGYLLKPVVAEHIKRTLDQMITDWRKEVTELPKNIRVQTFGNFAVFVDDKPIVFEREKAKELLAYLIDRKGASVSSAEIATVLWEDKESDNSTMAQVRVIRSSLIKTLKQAGISEIVTKAWNSLALDVSKIKCDAYDFENGDAAAVNSYRGEYMANYSWAEFTNGIFYDKKFKD